MPRQTKTLKETPLPAGKLREIVTYLEMRAPPKPRPSVGNHRGIRVARDLNMGSDFYRYLYQRVGTPWLWYERNHLSDSALREIINHRQNHLYVLYVDRIAAGFAELDFRNPPELELAYFGVISDHFGRGLGRLLLRRAIKLGWELNPSRLWLHTCNHDHPRALPLYLEEGFIPYRKEENIIDDPRLSDYPTV